MKKSKKPKKSARVSKVSRVKMANKQKNKLVKQGKIKKTAKSGLYKQQAKQLKANNQAQQEAIEDAAEAEEEALPLDMLDQEELDAMVDHYSRKKRARAHDEGDGVEDTYKKRPRAQEKAQRPLLPLKTEEGFVQRFAPPDESDQESDADTESSQVVAETTSEPTEVAPVSVVELMAERRRILRSLKERVATLSLAVSSDPEGSTSQLRELRHLSLSREVPPSGAKIVILSLKEVFLDLIPGYRVRELTEEEKKQRVKKELRSRRDFEETLLKQYRLFLQALEAHVRGKFYSSLGEPVRSELRLLATKCLSELIVRHHEFNYSSNILSVLVPLMKEKDERVSETACAAMQELFSKDRLGEVSLEAVRLISRMVKADVWKTKRRALDTLLWLHIEEANSADKREDDKDRPLTYKEKKATLSKRQRKMQKEKEQLEQDMAGSELQNRQAERARLHTRIMDAIFWTYFRILKRTPTSPLLASVLEGLAQFAHFINVDFLDDLIDVLESLVESQTLSVVDQLHCLLAVLGILSGPGSALTIDPQRLYRRLYALLPRVSVTCSDSEVRLVLQCVDSLLIQRKKKVSVGPLLAFIKRLATSCLQQSSPGAIATLLAIRMLLTLHPQTELLFDCDREEGSLYNAELPDPDHCSASGACLWELPLLRKHFDPQVRNAAKLVTSSNITAIGELATKHPAYLFDELSAVEHTAQLKAAARSGKKVAKGHRPLSEQFQKLCHRVEGQCNTDAVDFSALFRPHGRTQQLASTRDLRRLSQ